MQERPGRHARQAGQRSAARAEPVGDATGRHAGQRRDQPGRPTSPARPAPAQGRARATGRRARPRASPSSPSRRARWSRGPRVSARIAEHRQADQRRPGAGARRARRAPTPRPRPAAAPALSGRSCRADGHRERVGREGQGEQHRAARRRTAAGRASPRRSAGRWRWARCMATHAQRQVDEEDRAPAEGRRSARRRGTGRGRCRSPTCVPEQPHGGCRSAPAARCRPTKASVSAIMTAAPEALDCPGARRAAHSVGAAAAQGRRHGERARCRASSSRRRPTRSPSRPALTTSVVTASR